MEKEALLQRLDAIGQSLQRADSALALLGLGSVGTELDRIDAYSDLDFFVIVRDGTQAAYITDLGWLQAVSPIAYAFPNSKHGSKVLFADGIYAEYAVFGLTELSQMTFPEARIVWKADGVDDQIRVPQQIPVPPPRPLEEALGELVTNLYVGLGRYHRGERLSAMRFIQGYAVDRLLELAPRIAAAQAGHRDVFGAERRFEQRFPTIAAELPRFTQGYDRSPESAAAILAFVERHWAVNPAIKAAIVAMLPAEVAAPGTADGSGETA